MKYLVTWTSPIVFHEGDASESMGVYGVEGSKPGAAAVATWLTHRTLGLDKEGYGRLLGEAIFSCTKVCPTPEPSPAVRMFANSVLIVVDQLYCHWATMVPQSDSDPLIVVPLIRLPAEKKNNGDVVAEKKRIREKILARDNQALFEDKDTWKFLCELGGDLMINAFACNFKLNGKVNQDVVSQKHRLDILLVNHADNRPPISPGRSKLPEPVDLLTALRNLQERRG